MEAPMKQSVISMNKDCPVLKGPIDITVVEKYRSKEQSTGDVF